MTDIVLRLVANPGTYRLGLYDTDRQQVVAVGKGVPRHLNIGDDWVIRDGDAPEMIVITWFSFDDNNPTRYAYCLVDARAVVVRG